MKQREIKREKQQKRMYKAFLFIALLGHAIMNIFLLIMLFKSMEVVTIIRTIVLTLFVFFFIAIIFFRYWKTKKQKIILSSMILLYIGFYMIKYIV